MDVKFVELNFNSFFSLTSTKMTECSVCHTHERVKYARAWCYICKECLIIELDKSDNMGYKMSHMNMWRLASFVDVNGKNNVQ